MSPEYTGPPIGNPPEHVHDVEPVTEAIEEAQEETDELLDAVAALNVQNTEIVTEIKSCQTRLTELSTRVEAITVNESPMLTQIVSQLTLLQTELGNLRSSVEAMTVRQRNESLSHPPNLETQLSEQNPEQLTEEPSVVAVENPQPETPPETRPRKRVFF